jgi:hypothetical protein
MENQETMITSFIEITSASLQEAQTLLESTDYNLEAALNLFWEFQKPSSSATNPSSSSPNSFFEEDEIRAPIPAKKQRLIEHNIPPDFYLDRGLLMVPVSRHFFDLFVSERTKYSIFFYLWTRFPLKKFQYLSFSPSRSNPSPLISPLPLSLPLSLPFPFLG